MEMENTGTIICEFDVTTLRFISMSESSKEVYGYTPDEMIDRCYKDFCLPEFWDYSDDAVAKNVNTDFRLQRFYNEYRHKDGSIVKNIWQASNPIDDITICIGMIVK